MLLVVASRYDETAANLVSRWSAHDAALITPADLSSPGWRLSLGDGGRATAATADRIVDAAEITGVLTRLPGVWEAELVGIDAEDRVYVAAEMTAFLLAWLSELECPVVNPPTPGCLSGPFWRLERWLAAAAGLGIPVRPLRRSSEKATRRNSLPAPDGVWATVVGQRALGEFDEQLAAQARALSRMARTPLLGVHFSGSSAGACFLGAELWPDVGGAETADAVLELLLGS
jgi:hypothetical protein